MKTQTTTKCRIKTTNKDGEAVFSITSEDAYNKKVKEAAANGGTPPELVKSQTFSLSLAESADEALQLSGNDEAIEMVHFNYGASLRQHNEANDLLADDDFAPQEGTLDLAYAIAEKSEGRRKMSNEEKAAKLCGVSLEQIKAALALVQNQAAQQASA
jgi:hypothetical protein